MSYNLSHQQRERSLSRGRSRTHSRSSSVGSNQTFSMEDALSPVQRWNGHTREATDWNSLRRDSELWHPQGNCLVYLFERGASRRGPSFRIPYDFLLYSSCRPLIEQSLSSGIQTSLYHPGSTTPPSYDNLDETLSHESSYCSLHLDAPPELSRIERFNHHITTRNFFAWLVGAPLVGTDPISALLDLKIRMDIWRDVGADNFGSLYQYVQEQEYGDFEDLEIQMGKRLTGDTHNERPQPYRNVAQTMERQQLEKEVTRGRRSSISSIGQSLRSGSQKLRKKISRSFSRSRAPSETRTVENNATFEPPRPVEIPTLSRDIPTSRPASVSRPASIMQRVRRRLSFAEDPLTVNPANGSTISVPQNVRHETPSLALQTKDLPAPASPIPISAPARSSRRPLGTTYTPRSASASKTSLPDLSICACCGKPRRPTGVDSRMVPLHAEQVKQSDSGSFYNEVTVPNYGNGTEAPSSSSRRYSNVSTISRTGRHSRSHSFVSAMGDSSSRTPSVPGLEYGTRGSPSSDSDSICSPLSRDPSLGPDGQGRRERRKYRGSSPKSSISNPTLLTVNGMESGGMSPVSPISPGDSNLDQLIWDLSREGIGEVGKGKGKGKEKAVEHPSYGEMGLMRWEIEREREREFGVGREVHEMAA